MDPPGSAIKLTPDLCARSMLSPKGKKASEPRDTPVRGVQPGPPFLAGQGFRPGGEDLLPRAVGQHVLVFVGDIYIDGVVPIRAADIAPEGQGQHLGMLPQIPDVRLVARQTGAVDPALLPRADADDLAVLGVSDGIGLGILQRDQGNEQIPLGRLG